MPRFRIERCRSHEGVAGPEVFARWSKDWHYNETDRRLVVSCQARWFRPNDHCSVECCILAFDEVADQTVAVAYADSPFLDDCVERAGKVYEAVVKRIACPQLKNSHERRQDRICSVI